MTVYYEIYTSIYTKIYKVNKYVKFKTILKSSHLYTYFIKNLKLKKHQHKINKN